MIEAVVIVVCCIILFISIPVVYDIMMGKNKDGD